jgi:putative membrane protein insertion efficiency factor
MKKFLIGIIKVYQRFFSRYISRGQCRFTPTCSEFAILALTKYSFPSAIRLTIMRLLKCRYPYKGVHHMLRCFRDEILLKSFLGRFFVSTYYLLSPPAAKIVASSDFLRSIVRSILINPILKLAKRNLANK